MVQQQFIHVPSLPQAHVDLSGVLFSSPEPLKHPLLSGASSFTKHAPVLTASIRDGFTNIGKDAPGK